MTHPDSYYTQNKLYEYRKKNRGGTSGVTYL